MRKNLLTYILTTFIIITGFFISINKAQASSTDNIYGWGWSDTVGWISFNNCSDPAVVSTCTGQNYGVKYDTTGDVTGYAWSDTVGWIQFGGLGGFPGVGGQAHIDTTTGQMTGWAKVISLENPNDNEVSSDWADGWISLSGLASNGAKSPYGISFNMTTGLPNTNSFAWGSNVLGWITFGQVKLKTTLVAPPIDPKIIITVTELNASGVPVNVTGGTNPPINKASATSTTTVNGSDGTTIINGHKLKIEWGAQDVDYATCEGRNTYSDPNWDWNPPSYLAPFTPSTSWGSALTNILSPAQETNMDITLRCKAKNANKALDPYITATINIDIKAPAPSLVLYANGQTNANGNVIYVQSGVDNNVTLSSKGNNLDLNSGNGDWPTADPVKGVLCPKALNIFTNYIPFTLNTLGVYTYTISCNSDTGNRIDSSVTINVVKKIPNSQELLLRITDLTNPANTKDALSSATNTSVSSTLSGDILESHNINIEWGTNGIVENERQAKCFASSSVKSNWDWTLNPYDATINPLHLGSAVNTPSAWVSPLPGSITYEVTCSELASGISLKSSITVNIKSNIISGDSLMINPIGNLDCRADSFSPTVDVSPSSLDLSGEKCVFRINGPNGFTNNVNASPSPSYPSTSYSIGGLPGNNSASLQNYDVTLVCSTISSNTQNFGINSCVQTSSLNSNMRDMCVDLKNPKGLLDGDKFSFNWSSTNMVHDGCDVTETDQNGVVLKEYKDVGTSGYQAFTVNSPLSSFELSCKSNIDGSYWRVGPALAEIADKDGLCHTVKAKKKAPIYKEI